MPAVRQKLHLSSCADFRDRLSSHITIPFASGFVDYLDTQDFSKFFRGYTYTKEFREACVAQQMRAMVLDLNMLFAAVLALVSQHQRLIQLAGPDHPYQAKIRLRNIWRRIPFLDLALYRDFVQNYGLPISQVEHVLIPPGDSFIDLPANVDDAAMRLFIDLCWTFGIPADKIINGGEEAYSDLLGMHSRAVAVQDHRYGRRDAV